ncbi:hypothetical protein C8Q80DRAFT_1119636 [Daedaleopsis nitida]|nr:hypothetical protein C8Q80DRAFT_1119636 [Daedaleopsis nitida]
MSSGSAMSLINTSTLFLPPPVRDHASPSVTSTALVRKDGCSSCMLGCQYHEGRTKQDTDSPVLRAILAIARIAISIMSWRTLVSSSLPVHLRSVIDALNHPWGVLSDLYNLDEYTGVWQLPAVVIYICAACAVVTCVSALCVRSSTLHELVRRLCVEAECIEKRIVRLVPFKLAGAFAFLLGTSASFAGYYLHPAMTSWGTVAMDVAERHDKDPAHSPTQIEQNLSPTLNEDPRRQTLQHIAAALHHCLTPPSTQSFRCTTLRVPSSSGAMNLYSLNDDVLRHICDYLVGKHALNLSLVSRRAHDLAINRVVAVFVATDSKTLHAFHQYVLNDTHPRTQYIEGVELEYTTLYRDEESSQDLREPEEEDHAFDAKKVQLLIDLLDNACNLRTLILHFRADFMMESSKLAAALTDNTLCHLQWVVLWSVNDAVVRLLAQTAWHLRVLDLSYSGGPISSVGHISFLTLLDAITNFPNLHALKITNLVDIDMVEFRTSLDHILQSYRYPSIRQLSVACGESLFALCLVEHCPNVELVTFDIVRPYGLNKERLNELSLSFAQWRPLHSLCGDVYELYETYCNAGLVELNVVSHFMTTRELRVVDPDGVHQQNVSMLQSVLRTLSPVWAQLSLEIGGAPLRFWRDVPACAPRLLYLDLKVSLPCLKEEYATWLDSIPDALNALPLLYLGIHLRARIRFSEDDPNPTAREFDSEMTREREVQLHADHDASARMLPARCAKAIPTLRFFTLFHDFHGRGFAEEERLEDVDVLRGWSDVPELLKRQAIETEWTDFIPWEDIYTWEARLWRVAGEGEGEGRGTAVLCSG